MEGIIVFTKERERLGCGGYYFLRIQEQVRVVWEFGKIGEGIWGKYEKQ